MIANLTEACSEAEPMKAPHQSVQKSTADLTAGSLNKGMLQRKCACGGTPGPSGECATCRKKRLALQREPAAGGGGVHVVPPIVHEVLSSSGQSIVASTRAFMESRFGHEFSTVKVHVGSKAAESAKAVRAVAYTVGQHIVFGARQYAPGTGKGNRLLAHELTHTIQQKHSARSAPRDLKINEPADAGEREANRLVYRIFANEMVTPGDFSPAQPSLQRACGPKLIGTPTGCTDSSTTAVGDRYFFEVNCDKFWRKNRANLVRDARKKIMQGDIVEVHGFASIEGDPTFNEHLSCARALKALAVIRAVLAQRGISATIRVFKHGATPGNRTEHRSVVVTRRSAPPPPQTTCGPDATDWLVRQVAAAKTDSDVLAVKADLDSASRVAARFGFSAERVAEGGIAKRVAAAETRAGSPTRTTEARSQFTSSIPGQRAFGRTFVAATVPFFVGPEALVLVLLRRAANRWKNLVGSQQLYDFKNDKKTMKSPTSPNCPVNCSNTITMCPSTGLDCFLTDVPGNLFYAHVGRFVGWTELSLQLGSQFAQLTSKRSWDPPEDTQMIHAGFGLPHPLTRSALCSAMARNRSIFKLRPCSNCPEQTTAATV